MFSKVGNAPKEPPTEYEVGRLRRLAFSEQINRFILESFDTITNLAFVFVLFDQSLSVNISDSWYSISVQTCGRTTEATNENVAAYLFNLGIAAAVCFIVKMMYRAFTVTYQIIQNRHRIVGVKDTLFVVAGFFLTFLDPFDGLIFVSSYFTGKPLVTRDSERFLRELRSSWALIFIETLPQFVIVVIYGVIAADNAHLGLPPAWFVTTVTTSIRLLNQLHDVLYLQFNYKRITALAQNGRVWVQETKVVRGISRKISDLNHNAADLSSHVAHRVSDLSHHLPQVRRLSQG